MKKSILLFVLSVFCLTGCSTFAQMTKSYQETMKNRDPYLYRPLTYYIEDHGAPIASYRLEDDIKENRTIYTFIEPCPTSSTMQKILVTVYEADDKVHEIRKTNTCPEN